MGMVSLRARVEQRILVLLHAAGFLGNYRDVPGSFIGWQRET